MLVKWVAISVGVAIADVVVAAVSVAITSAIGLVARIGNLPAAAITASVDYLNNVLDFIMP